MPHPCCLEGNSHFVGIPAWLSSPLTLPVRTFFTELSNTAWPAPGWSCLDSGPAPPRPALLQSSTGSSCCLDRCNQDVLVWPEAPTAGGLIDISKSMDWAKEQTRLQSIQPGQEPWGIRLCHVWLEKSTQGQCLRKREGKWGGSHIRHDYNGEEQATGHVWTGAQQLERFSQAKSLQLTGAKPKQRPPPLLCSSRGEGREGHVAYLRGQPSCDTSAAPFAG